MRLADPLPIFSEDELQTWARPDTALIKEKLRPRCENGITALHAVMLGTSSVSHSASTYHLCPKRLLAMAMRAPELAPDGHPWGYRVCVPWGAYQVQESQSRNQEMPRKAQPHSMQQLLAAQPKICDWVEAYDHPLPPGRPPRTFVRLHEKIVQELTRLGSLECYPLNHKDRGRRALLRYLRRQRVGLMTEALNAETPSSKPATSLAQIFACQLYDRSEADGHHLDIEAKLGVAMPNGGQVQRDLSTLWFIPNLETTSHAVLSWVLRVGRNYNSLDMTTCIAREMLPWSRRALVIPKMSYAPMAGMPSGLSPEMARRRVLLTAMDNHKGHHALAFEQAYCRAHDGVLNLGRAHEPRARSFVERLAGVLESGAFRDIPGGFEPATRLGENKIRISNFSPEDCPVQLHLLEELLDVIVADYNATPQTALGNLSPLQYLLMHANDRRWFYEAPDNLECAREMGSVLVPVNVVGSRTKGDLPHVNFAYVEYRNAELENAWELAGRTLLAKVYRHDLRTIALYGTATQPMGILQAARPWHLTIHDETTRKMIFQWARQGLLKLTGVECAIAAYVEFLRAYARTSQTAVDQLARIQQQQPNFPTPGRRPEYATQRVPRSGWVNLDQLRDL